MPESSREGEPGRLRELDGWRAVAVLIVIAGHLGTYQREQAMARIPGLSWVVHGFDPLGVAIFLVTSGFLICRLLIAEEQRHGTVSLKGFYWRGALRILPPLYLYLAAIAVLLQAGVIKDSWRGIFTAAAFLFDVGFLPTWFTSHTWRLSIEAQFYLLLPAAWILLPKPWRARGLLGILCALPAWNLIVLSIGASSKMLIEMREGFACIGCGALLALHEQKARSIASAVPGWLVAAVALLLLSRPIHTEAVAFGFYQTLAVPLAIGLVLVFSLDRGRWLRALLCSKPMHAVGLTSYGIYLWQQLFTAAPFFFTGAGQLIPRFLPLLFVIVPLSYFFIEQPAMRRGRLLSNRARPT
jgi:peptidoglycan/LPS O-acetylase OafA/YrhL